MGSAAGLGGSGLVRRDDGSQGSHDDAQIESPAARALLQGRGKLEQLPIQRDLVQNRQSNSFIVSEECIYSAYLVSSLL